MSAIERLFTPRLAFLACVAIAASQYLVFVLALAGLSPDYTLGGDFAAFWSAAKETLNGNITSLYNAEAFEKAIHANSPHSDLVGLTWQYPPHATLLFSPIGALPFHVAYGVWALAGFVLYALALASIGFRQRVLVAALATIPVLLAIGTGQNGLFTAALLMVAVFQARSRPLVAGLAAALLTIKPQLGFLLPVLFIAGGHWRAFAYAALGSILFVAVSIGVFGLEAWFVFFESVRSVSGSVATGMMPLFKMVNLYAASRLLGLPELVVFAMSGAMVLAAVAATIWISRRTEDPKWRYAVIACATLIAAPYSYYYELALIVPAIFFVLQRGYQAGWLRFERETIAAAALITLAVPGLPIRSGMSPTFILMALVSVIVVRRIHAEFAARTDAQKTSAQSAVSTV